MTEGGFAGMERGRCGAVGLPESPRLVRLVCPVTLLVNEPLQPEVLIYFGFSRLSLWFRPTDWIHHVLSLFHSLLLNQSFCP